MQQTDWRNIVNGLEIPTVSYSDQPFVVKADDGAWLCCVTTGNKHRFTGTGICSDILAGSKSIR